MVKNENVAERIYILGASLYAEEIADFVLDSSTHDLCGFIEGVDQKKCSQYLFERPILWVDEISDLDNSCKGICAGWKP